MVNELAKGGGRQVEEGRELRGWKYGVGSLPPSQKVTLQKKSGRGRKKARQIKETLATKKSL